MPHSTSPESGADSGRSQRPAPAEKDPFVAVNLGGKRLRSRKGSRVGGFRPPSAQVPIDDRWYYAHNCGKSAAGTSGREQSMGLKVLVIGMGVLIVAGVAVVLVTIVNRSLAPPAGVGEVRWQLPQGAEVKDWRVAGDELVVRLEQDGAVLFWTFDRRSGQRLGEVRLESGSNP